MEQFQESTDHLVNLQKVEDVSTKDNHQNAEKVFSQGFPQSENVNKDVEDLGNNEENVNSERKITNQIFMRNFRATRLKKQGFLVEKKKDEIPKYFKKWKKSHKKMGTKQTLKKSGIIIKNNNDFNVFHENSPKQIHIKEENPINKKSYYHSYREFTPIIDYLSKFEWYNNASFQNKQLPIKFFTPICFWFIVCYNYFPRFIFQKEIGHFMEGLLAKCSRIVPETKIRLNKNLIKTIARNNVDSGNVEDLSELINDVLNKSLKSFINDNVQKNYEKRQFQKNNYTNDDDLFLIDLKKFLMGKVRQIQEFIKNKEKKYSSVSDKQLIISLQLENSNMNEMENEKNDKAIDKFLLTDEKEGNTSNKAQNDENNDNENNQNNDENTQNNNKNTQINEKNENSEMRNEINEYNDNQNNEKHEDINDKIIMNNENSMENENQMNLENQMILENPQNIENNMTFENNMVLENNSILENIENNAIKPNLATFENNENINKAENSNKMEINEAVLNAKDEDLEPPIEKEENAINPSNNLQEINDSIDMDDPETLEIIKRNMKKISLNNLINLYSYDLTLQQKENRSMIDKVQEGMEKEKKIQEIFEVEDSSFDEMIVDLSFFTKVENDYLNLLENKQQNSHLTKNSPFKEIEVTSKDHDENKMKVYNHSEDTVCQICNDGDYIEENLIVFCSKCNISVHQCCYGIMVIPHGDWICDLCKEIGPSGKFLKCPLCQEIGGAMKKSILTCETQLFVNNNPSFHEYLKKCQRFNHNHNITAENAEHVAYNDEHEPTPFDVWAHVTCVLWLPETYFQDKLTYTIVRGLDNIDIKKFECICFICQSANSGACIQCAKNKCQISFHPECARRAKLNMEVKLTDKVMLSYYIYCEKHTPLKLKRIIENKEKKYQEEIIKFARTIEKYYETYTSEHKIRTTQIIKSKKIFKKYLKKTKVDHIKDLKTFLTTLKDNFNSFEQNKFMIYLNKNEEKDQKIDYEINSVNCPKTMFSYIPKNDFFWQNFNYKNLEPAQLYRKYYSFFKKIKGKNHHPVLEPPPQPKLIIEIKKTPDIKTEKTTPIKTKTNTPKKLMKDDPNKLYCVCHKPYKEGERMMECGICLEWFHFECIGYSGSLEQALEFNFICPECNLKNKPIKNTSITPSKKKTHEKKEDSIKKNIKDSLTTIVSNSENTKKKEKIINNVVNNENLPVCKRTRIHSISSLQMKISSSTPRKEKSMEKNKTTLIENEKIHEKEKKKHGKEKKKGRTPKQVENTENLIVMKKKSHKKKEESLPKHKKLKK